ncbi:MAG: HypC/HybG/HupF family hydrogenase formation chaperone [Nitrosomonas sp.]|jgi:hydrogenase expression/formation protein HypC|uniref:HypC/HybG/HupF family hydrogenase formation chaperone n=1 Tax=Nitrosomonas sp. TaxID=42353 RepID=UPI001D755DF1|nr:HypC/HybG/HupF family hydrogenase formation chaperone [Nitrosomonas sp.]MBX9894514.1 HypC/HybG/HupF family hydrogenase formation chaperone [Nitrosomonas sp.]
MCLAIPAYIEQLTGENYAIVNMSGIRKEISLELVDNAAPGDYVVVHAGFALQKLDPIEAQLTLAMFAEMSDPNNNDMAQ